MNGEKLSGLLSFAHQDEPGEWITLEERAPSLCLAARIESGSIPELEGMDVQVFTREAEPLGELEHPDDTPAWEIHVRIRPTDEDNVPSE